MTRNLIIPSIFTIGAFFILLSLGTWQIERMQWKNQLISITEERLQNEVTTFPGDLSQIDDLYYSKLKLTGRFLNAKEIHLYTGANQFKGGQGYNIITPFELKDGKIILIDRGWVPLENKSQENRPDSQIEQEVTLEGIMLKGEAPGKYTPENNTEDNLWFFIDIPAISNLLEVPLDDFYIKSLSSFDNAGIFVENQAKVKMRNDHMEYAITWYLLAIIVVLVYFFYARNIKNTNKTKE